MLFIDVSMRLCQKMYVICMSAACFGVPLLNVNLGLGLGLVLGFSKLRSAATYLPYPKSMFAAAPFVFPPSTQHQEQQLQFS